MKEFKYKINGNEYTVNVNEIEDNKATVVVNGTSYEVELDKPAKEEVKPVVRPQAPAAAPAAEPAVSRPAAPAAGAGNAVRSPLPGVILEINVAVGDAVKAGQKVAVLEAMKMENVISATHDGTVTAIKVNKGDSILEGADIIVIG